MAHKIMLARSPIIQMHVMTEEISQPNAHLNLLKNALSRRASASFQCAEAAGASVQPCPA